MLHLACSFPFSVEPRYRAPAWECTPPFGLACAFMPYEWCQAGAESELVDQASCIEWRSYLDAIVEIAVNVALMQLFLHGIGNALRIRRLGTHAPRSDPGCPI